MPCDPFYSLPAWRTIRRQVLKRDRYACVMCRADVRKLGASRVDHILSRRKFPALALTLGNLRTLCAACDNRQQLERDERRDAPRFERVDASGMTAAWRKEGDAH